MDYSRYWICAKNHARETDLGGVEVPELKAIDKLDPFVINPGRLSGICQTRVEPSKCEGSISFQVLLYANYVMVYQLIVLEILTKGESSTIWVRCQPKETLILI